MLRPILLSGLLVASFALAPAAAQGDCSGNVMLNDTDLVYAVQTTNGLWLYAEGNGQGGLQRGGVSPFGDADPCQETETPDILLF